MKSDDEPILTSERVGATNGTSTELLERLVALAENELRSRKMRARFLPEELFGEGGWSMLLDLFVSEYHGRKVSTTSACIAADVPATTALRWLDLLEKKGLIQRALTTRDKRVKYVALTNKAREALCALLRRQLLSTR
ncbi:hypothetical protein [Erythrobacter sp. WG]|uniref:hypothetical protein n=1 Tax=Erythrobacter sp. WG TaxID=2985510 RepID=UPI00226F8AE7|nr:hypothetical protein [Erythrobacter sp. WG]MCX9148797.1 hypothetical protein [Erythrobacter sp. WG]